MMALINKSIFLHFYVLAMGDGVITRR